MRPPWVFLALIATIPLPAQADAEPTEAPESKAPLFHRDQVDTIPWRQVGPANMAGRITDIEVPVGQDTTWYIASASGGLFKTTNAGVTWKTLFDDQPTVSLGDVAVAPSNPDVVWVGTGEENARNSVSWGDGVYKSTDGGESWTHMGLERTFQIGHIAIHPEKADVVYVAALGRLWGHNPERGIFRTTDGGETWEHVLYLDDKTGAIDVLIDPSNPDTVYAAMYERFRDGFDSNDPVVRFGEKSGLFRSDDGGETWKKLTNGLPSCNWGRTGLDLWDEDPNVLFAIIETERSGWATGSMKDDPNAGQRVSSRALGLRGRNAPEGARLTAVTDNSAVAKAGLKVGDVITGWGETQVDSYSSLLRAMRKASIGDTVELTVVRDAKSFQVELTIEVQRSNRRGSAYMGITGEDGDDGALLSTVTEGGPSYEAGLRDGDLLVKLGDTSIASYTELIRLLRRARAEDKVKVTVKRGTGEEQEELTFDLTYGQRPTGPAPANGPFGGRLGGQRANVQAEQGEDGHETGGIFRSDDRGETWKRINSLTDRPFYYSVIRVDPKTTDNIYHCGTTFYESTDGGENFEQANREIHVDFHALWINPANPEHMLLGCDGGLNITHDRCKTWEVRNNFVMGQFYHADVDTSVPYRIYGGLQDNGTWGGPSQTRYSEGITAADWVQIYGGDGFRARIDPTDPTTVYATSQNGGLGRVDMKTGATSRVQRPGGDFKFNWSTPFFLSPHNPRILFFAGDHAFRSLDRGRASEQLTEQMLGLTDRGTATAFVESPAQAGLLYVGTDDGAVWRSENHGHTWSEIHSNIPGMPGPRYVSSLCASHADADRVYITLDGHRSDDFLTHVYVSEDRGNTWTSLLADLPDEPCHIVMEDPRNEDLLFLGTEFSCYASLDRGESWLYLGADFPTVAVRDLAIQDRDSDLIAATHGRGLWVLDIEPLRQLTGDVAEKAVHLFEPEAATLWNMRRRSLLGNHEWRASNPPYGAVIYALFAEAPEKDPVLTIRDITGTKVASVKGKAKAGLQRFVWNARVDAKVPDDAPRWRRRGPRAQPGAYSVELKIGEETLSQPLLLRADPTAPATIPTQQSESDN